MDDLEKQCVNPTTLQATNATLGLGLLTMPIVSNSTQMTGPQPPSATSLSSSQAGPSQAVVNKTGLPGPTAHSSHNSRLHDAVILDVNAFQANPTILQSVSHILSSLEASSKAEAIQGKPTKNLGDPMQQILLLQCPS